MIERPVVPGPRRRRVASAAVPGAALLAGAVILASSAVAAPPSSPLPTPEYSFDAASPTIVGGLAGAADVLELGVARPRPIFRRDALQLSSALDEVDALSGSNPGIPPTAILALLFSVDRDTVGAVAPDPELVRQGVPFNVTDQVTRHHGAGDQYIAADSFTKLGVALPASDAAVANNILSLNNFDEGGSDFGASPASHAATALDGSASIDSVDAMATLPRRDSDGDVDRLYFSLAVGSPSLMILAGGGEPSGADVYLARRPRTGPCCRPDGECLVVTSPECMVLGGVWLGPDAACTDCTADRGVCCLEAGCAEIPPFACSVMGGTFFPGRTCGEIDCDDVAYGACCLWSGDCAGGVTAEACAAVDGAFFEGSTCDEVACARPRRGACCTPHGCVGDVLEQHCIEAGGVFSPDRACDEVECASLPRGACCLPNEICLDGVTPGVCAAFDGRFFAQRSCEELACDPAEDGREDGLVAADPGGGPRLRSDDEGNDALAVLAECEVPGVCCLPDGSCAVIDPVPCAAAGGAWLGERDECALCATPGPCCLPGGACAPETAAACATAGGLWLGPDAMCGDCAHDRPMHQIGRYAHHGQLGLVAADDIDAMIVFDENDDGRFNLGDRVLFSLAPGSPSLATIPGASPVGAAADVFFTRAGWGPRLFAPARLLGLGAATDNIDALDATIDPAGLGGAAEHGIRACGLR